MAQANPSLEELLTKIGCPYPAGSSESVAWLQGRKFGVSECLGLAQGKAEIVIGWPPEGAGRC